MPFWTGAAADWQKILIRLTANFLVRVRVAQHLTAIFGAGAVGPVQVSASADFFKSASAVQPLFEFAIEKSAFG